MTMSDTPVEIREALAKHLYAYYWSAKVTGPPRPWADISKDAQNAFHRDADDVLTLLSRTHEVRGEPERRPPVIAVAEGKAGPHCGRCGVPYSYSGSGPSKWDWRTRLESYVPRCDCWRAAPVQPEGVGDHQEEPRG